MTQLSHSRPPPRPTRLSWDIRGCRRLMSLDFPGPGYVWLHVSLSSGSVSWIWDDRDGYLPIIFLPRMGILIGINVLLIAALNFLVVQANTKSCYVN